MGYLLNPRKNLRLKRYDYSNPGYYFVTICTKNRMRLFGDVVQGQMLLNDAGTMIQTVWQTLQQLYTSIRIDEFIVMPDHIHGIIIINKPMVGGKTTAPCSSISLQNIIKNFKSYTTFKYIKHVQQYAWEPFEKKLWQRSYYEHIIRNEDRLKTIRQYYHKQSCQFA